MAERQLVELFHSCDKKGTGRIGPEEFRNLCAEFDIEPADSNAIFADLDHDGDGEVSLEDFAWGFRDFLNPDSFASCAEERSSMEKSQLMDRRKSDARLAWSHLVEGIGEPLVYQFLNNSGKKLAQLYHDLQTSGSSPQLLTKFDGALSSLLQDVKRLYDDNQKLEAMFNKEREIHLQRLRGLEQEMDAQVAKIEAEAKQEAKRKFEQEKKEIMEKMESEMAELQTHLRMFQKVNSVLSQKREDAQTSKQQDATLETRELRSNLSDTRTNLALLHSEMAKIKAEYESKCRELCSHQETVMQYMDQNKNIHRQLQLLQQANRNLQDTNDGLLSIIEASGGRVTPYCCSRAGSENESSAGNTPNIRRKCRSRSRYQSMENVNTEHMLPNDHGNNINNGTFAIERFMEDIGDSGRSTLRDTIECDSDHKSLHEEFFNLSDAESALKSLESMDSSKYSCPTLRNNTGSKTHSKSTSVYVDVTGNPDRTYKVVFAGDAAVGKSCFIHRFSKGTFANKLGSTLGVDFQIKTIRVDEKLVALQLWDTAGQERFRSMTKTYFRRADGVVLLYDVTNERTFLNVRQWVQSISEVTDKEIPILICGNKVDLRDEQDATVNCVSTKHGEDLAQSYQTLFYETSSKTGHNIVDALLAISREMLLKEDVEVQTSALKVTQIDKRSKLCCGKN